MVWFLIKEAAVFPVNHFSPWQKNSEIRVYGNIFRPCGSIPVDMEFCQDKSFFVLKMLPVIEKCFRDAHFGLASDHKAV